MKYLVVIASLLLGWCCPASAQFNGCQSGFCAVQRPSAGGTPTLTYIGSATPSYSGNVATATAASIGTASSGRLVVVVFLDIGGAANSTASVTIGGNAATVNIVANSTFDPHAGIASLVVPAGTTANIVVTYGGTAGGFGDFEVYTITGLSSTTAVAAAQNWDGSANPLSTTLATSSGGVVIVGSMMPGGTGTVSFSGTETYAIDRNGIAIAGFSNGAVGHATGTSTNASSSVTSTWSASTGHTTIVAASWR